MLKIIAWRLLAISSVVLGGIGVVIPGLPTVPFLLLAAWAGTHGWPRLEAWLLGHPKYGPSIREWREHGAVSRRAKIAASVMMLLSVMMIAISAAHVALKLGVPAILMVTAAWLWTRPEPEAKQGQPEDRRAGR
ncbi:YbaN family protein [Alcanivorax sp.]|jgi:uncharacterized membrane protein YbaN (DUF454 family)|uniref:YbaN family protein n=1 Tax=Alcanivorax sp. TaxID=1872427 RepID=UPI0032D97F13